MRRRTLMWIAIGVVGAIVLGSLTFLLLEQLLRRPSLPGDAASAILEASPYPNLIIEVDRTPGDQPTAFALNLVRERIAAYAAKESVQIELSDVITVNQTTFTSPDLIALERIHRDHATAGDTFALYMLSLAGEFDPAANALGSAYTDSSLVLFKDVVRRATMAPGTSEQLVEASVLVHEVGHLMGLVNLVYNSDLDYEDREQPFHSNNQSDVMYWAIESAPFMAPPTDFASETQFDLRKLRDGEYTLFPSRVGELAGVEALSLSPEDRFVVWELRVRWLDN